MNQTLLSALLVAMTLFMEGCTHPHVNWDVALSPLTFFGPTLSPSLNDPSIYWIQGGVPPFKVALSGLGRFQMLDSRTISYSRPWQTGTAQFSVTDFLGATTQLTLTLGPGAVQLGGGADPLTAASFLGNDASGNFYVLGSTQASMVGNLFGIGGSLFGIAGNQMLYLTKIDKGGTVKWISQVSAGTYSNTTGLQLAVDPTSGKIYIVGTTDGTLPGTITGIQGTLNAFISQFDADGNLLWINQFGAEATSSTSPIQLILGSGGIAYVGGIITGSFVTAGVTGAIQSGSHGIQDTFLAQFSSTGALNWINQIGGGANGTTTFVQMVQDSSNNTFIGGTTDGNLGGTQSGIHGSLDAFVVEYSPTGVPKFIFQIGEGNGTTSSVTGITQDSAFNTYVLGTTTGTGATQLGSQGVQDTYVAQITPSGSLGWMDQLGGGNGANLLPSNLAVSGQNIYFIGTTDTDLTGLGTQYTRQIGTHGTLDLILVQLTNSGNLNWLKQIGSGNQIISISQLKIIGGNIYVSGSLYGSLGGVEIGTLGLQDAFLLNFSANGSLNLSAQIGGGGISYTSPIQFYVDGKGNTYYAGKTSGSLGGFTYGAHGNNDTFLIKMDSSGSAGWISQLGAGGSSQTIPVQFLPDATFNHFYIMGQATRNLIGALVGPSNFYNSYLIQLNSFGQIQ